MSIKITCDFCNKELIKSPCRIRSHNFCNNKCQSDYRWEKRKEEIESTGFITERRNGIRFLKETRGNKCEICGITEWNKKDITFVMDHIDGNSNNEFLHNLRLICPNCDSQLPTYKCRNYGKGRYSRRKRYSEGKSY